MRVIQFQLLFHLNNQSPCFRILPQNFSHLILLILQALCRKAYRCRHFQKYILLLFLHRSISVACMLTFLIYVSSNLWEIQIEIFLFKVALFFFLFGPQTHFCSKLQRYITLINHLNLVNQAFLLLLFYQLGLRVSHLLSKLQSLLKVLSLLVVFLQHFLYFCRYLNVRNFQ